MKPILILTDNQQIIEAVREEVYKIDPESASKMVVVRKKNDAISKLRNQKFEAILLDSADEKNYDFLFEYNCPSLLMTHPLERDEVEYFIKIGVKKILYYPCPPDQIANHFKRLIKS